MAMTKVGKLTVKHQVTIPRDVRQALGLKAGDGVVFNLRDGEAVVAKHEPDPMDDEAFEAMLRETMPEWFSTEDDEAFGDL